MHKNKQTKKKTWLVLLSVLSAIGHVVACETFCSRLVVTLVFVFSWITIAGSLVLLGCIFLSALEEAAKLEDFI